MKEKDSSLHYTSLVPCFTLSVFTLEGFCVSKVLLTPSSGFSTNKKKPKLFLDLILRRGARGGTVVKALRYKPAGREFDSRWCH